MSPSLHKEEENGMKELHEARWLAGREIRRTWLSYPATGLVMVLLGLLASATVYGFLDFEGSGRGVERFEEWYGPTFSDYIFLFSAAVLAVNYVSRDYLSSWSDSFSNRLLFMRGLPISPGTLVTSRMMAMSLALVFTVPAFFLPVYLLSSLDQLGWGYLWFTLIWIGYSLLGAGGHLYLELGIHGRTYNWIYFALVFAVLALSAFLEWAVDLRLVERIAGLAQDHGPLAAVLSLVIGAAGFALLGRAAVRRIERRELSA